MLQGRAAPNIFCSEEIVAVMGRPAGEWQLWVLLLLMYALVVVLAPLAS